MVVLVPGSGAGALLGLRAAAPAQVRILQYKFLLVNPAAYCLRGRLVTSIGAGLGVQ